MITLSNIASRIEALEESEFSAIDERLSVWYAMVSWQFFVAQYGNAETAKKVLYSLPNDHEMRITVGKLTWFMHYFASALPDTTWQSEKAEICFASWLEEAIAENFSESALCCEEAMNDAIQFCATCLTNGTLNFYDEKKKEEQETWQKKLEYRRLANFGELTPEAIEWLKTYDSAFLENFTAKKETKPEVVKPITPQVIPQAMPEVLPTAPKPVNDNFVVAHWAGLDENWLMQTADGTLPIFRNREYRLTADVWGNIQGDSYLRQRWHEIKR